MEISKIQLNKLITDAEGKFTPREISERLLQTGHTLEGFEGTYTPSVTTPTPTAPVEKRSLWERFKSGFGTEETREEAQEIEAAEGRRGFQVSDLPGDIADIAGGVPSFISTAVFATMGGTAGAAAGGVGAIPGAAAGATIGYGIGETARVSIGKMLGVRGDVTPEEATEIVTDAVFTGGTFWAFGRGGEVLRHPTTKKLLEPVSKKFLKPISDGVTKTIKESIPNWLIKPVVGNDIKSAEHFFNFKFGAPKNVLKQTDIRINDMTQKLDKMFKYEPVVGITLRKVPDIKLKDIAKATNQTELLKTTGKSDTEVLKLVEKYMPEVKTLFAKSKWDLSTANKVRTKLLEKTLNTSSDHEMNIVREFAKQLETQMLIKTPFLRGITREAGVSPFDEIRKTIGLKNVLKESIALNEKNISMNSLFSLLRLFGIGGGFAVGGVPGAIAAGAPYVMGPTGKGLAAQAIKKGVVPSAQFIKKGTALTAKQARQVMQKKVIDTPVSTFLKGGAAIGLGKGAAGQVAPHVPQGQEKLSKWLGI
ncbi:MAG: hypothetical protein KAU20_06005 [Nanoarchaeota archaeon]|nr:hypothetical protein [Nanoarchaeota archaeon]